MQHRNMYNGAVEAILTEITNEVNESLETGRELIKELYGSYTHTANQIGERFYKIPPEGIIQPIDAALNLHVILTDLQHWHRENPLIAMYQIGIFRACISISKTAMSEEQRAIIHSELGRWNVKKRWDLIDEAVEIAKREARKQWLRWKEVGGERIQHNKMADKHIKEKPWQENPKLQDVEVSKSRLLSELKLIAREIDSRLVYGERIKK